MRTIPFVVSTLALCLALGAHASVLEQRGSPQASPAVMPTYGFAVAPRLGLRSVAPAGWRLFIHQSVALPDSMAWRRGDPWPQVMAAFAASSGLAVLIDWEQRQILVRSPDIAAAERDIRTQAAQAATTPLPRLAPQRAASTGLAPSKGSASLSSPERAQENSISSTAAVSVAPVRSARSEAPAGPATPGAPASTSPAPPTALASQPLPHSAAAPVAGQAPSPAIVDSPVSTPGGESRGGGAPQTLSLQASSDEFSYQGPVAVHRPSAHRMARAIAQRFGAHLHWSAPEYQLRGPLTLLAVSAEQDVGLLQKAMGQDSPVAVTYDRERNTIRAVSRSEAAALCAVCARTRGSQGAPPESRLPLSAASSSPETP